MQAAENLPHLENMMIGPLVHDSSYDTDTAETLLVDFLFFS